ncbi:MAG: DUF2844 domain-containing protein [Pseudomonadota bacterium]
MRFRKYAKAQVSRVLLIGIGVVGLAHAELGGNINTIDNDRARLKAQTQAPVTASAAYTVYQMALPTQTVVRQYASANGTVFAVSWQGPFKPDLRQLLGPHFDTMVAHQSHVARGRFNLNQANLVIESGGHMRNFFGRAYLPADIPAGVTVQDIQ